MDKTGMDISLIGRKSRCKLTFFRASSSSDNPISNIATTQVPAWWTPDFAPRQTHLVQAPVHGFSPSGDRLLPARIRSVSVADIIEEESKTAAGDIKPCASCAVLLLVSADVVFHRGQPRTTRGRGSNPVKAAVVHARERLGGDKVKLAVAVSVDVEDDGAGKLVPSVVRSFLDEVRDDKELEGVPVLAVSPRTELWLRQQESEGGRVSYRRGDSNFRIRPAFEQLMNKKDIERARSAFEICGGTGIIAAVSAAVALDPPTLVFPVGDFVTLQSSGWGGNGAPAAPLRICRQLHPHSNARDVFAVEKSEGILSGDLVSAEIVGASADEKARAAPLPLEVDAQIGKGAWFVKLAANRKAAQVWKVDGATPGGRSGKVLASVKFGDLRSKERRPGKS